MTGLSTFGVSTAMTVAMQGDELVVHAGSAGKPRRGFRLEFQDRLAKAVPLALVQIDCTFPHVHDRSLMSHFRAVRMLSARRAEQARWTKTRPPFPASQVQDNNRARPTDKSNTVPRVWRLTTNETID